MQHCNIIRSTFAPLMCKSYTFCHLPYFCVEPSNYCIQLKELYAIFFLFAAGYAHDPNLGCVRFEPTEKKLEDAQAGCMLQGAHVVNMHPHSGHLYLESYLNSISKFYGLWLVRKTNPPLSSIRIKKSRVVYVGYG